MPKKTTTRAVLAANQGSRLTAVMAGHDRGPEYVLVECCGENFGCTQTAKVEDSKFLSDEEVTSRLAEAGWSVKPTLCPKHNITQGQVPLPVPEMAL